LLARKNASVFEEKSRTGVGRLLALTRSEFCMFRAISLSIALTLAAGPTAGQICKALCSPQSAAASGCHHDASTASPSVATDSNCDRAAVTVGAFFREEVERRAPAPYASDAVRVPTYRFPLLTINGGVEHQAAHDWSLASRPLTTALRI